METLVQDLRFAVRTLRQRPAFAVVAVLTLALGIGANTAIFSLVNGILFKSVGSVTQRAGLVEVSRNVDGRYWDVSYPLFEDLRSRSETLDDLCAVVFASVALVDDGEPTVHMGLAVTGNYFSVLGITPAHGRFFQPDESFYPRTSPLAVISHALWQERFDGDPGVVGRGVRINDHPIEIVGVAPKGFGGHRAGVRFDIYMILGTPAPGLPGLAGLGDANTSQFELLGRLKPGVSPSTAATELSVLGDQFTREHTQTAEAGSFVMRVTRWGPIPSNVRGGVRVFFSVLMVIVGLVLLMACSNVASMLLSRNSERRREIATRLSIGAGRGRIVQQLVTEASVLFALGGAAGGLLAIWATRLLLTFQPPLPAGIVVELDLSPDGRVFAFTVAVSIVAGLLSSLGPALRTARADLVSSLKDDAAAPSRSRLRGILVGVQMTATVLLLVAAGLFLRALQTMESLDPGFETERVYAMGFDLELKGYERERGRNFYLELARRMREMPGVESSSLAAKLPLAGRSSLGDINVAGIAAAEGRQGHAAYLNTVSPGYFRTLGLTLIQGRDVSDSDGPQSPIVAVINQTMARRFWSDEQAIGQQFFLGEVADGQAIEVIGVVQDAKYKRIDEQTPNFYYLPYQQRYNGQMTLHMRMAPGAESMVGGVRELVRELDAGLPLLPLQPMEELVGMFLLPQRLAAWVAGVMGLLGLSLAAVGVYGVTAFAVAQRTQEIGIRLALGARRRDLLWLMVRRALVPPIAGMAVGLVIAFVVTRLLSGLLAGVSPLDPLTFGVVFAALIGVAGTAATLPVHRASRREPASTLRAE